MAVENKKYWLSPEELDAPTEQADNDLSAWREPAPDHVRRRSFLKAVGFGVAGIAISGCKKMPKTRALPVLNQPPGMTPGRPMHYATVCGGCPAGCGVLAKCRDGRPIKLEGITGHPISDGGLCAVGHASLLGLYDSLRFRGPLLDQEPSTWASVDAAIKSRLEVVNRDGKSIRLITGTSNSPTLQHTINQFLQPFADSEQVTYDALSNSAIADAHFETHRVRAIPQFYFDKAEVIVSFGADFLGTWISPVEFTKRRTAGRQLDSDHPTMSYHVQFESMMTLTGSNADDRVVLAPREMGVAITHLASRIASLAGTTFESDTSSLANATRQQLDELADRLVAAKGKSLVVCGGQDLTEQKLCNFVNHLLENYGSTVDIARPSKQRLGNDGELIKLVYEMNQGSVDILLIHGCNPLAELPSSLGFETAVGKVGMVVQLATRPDDSTPMADIVCPVPHFLETWSDCEAKTGLFSIVQPVIQPLFDARPVIESLGSWSGNPDSSLQQIEKFWNDQVHPKSNSATPFREFFDLAKHDGWVVAHGDVNPLIEFNNDAIESVRPASEVDETKFTLVAYAKAGLLDGKHAYNPWLQELPDPVSKVTWDNYACLSVATASRLKVVEGDVIRLDIEGGQTESLELPVYVQPGTHDNVVAVALGYGSSLTERFRGIGPQWLESRPTVGPDGRVGKNIAPFLSLRNQRLSFSRAGVRITVTKKKHPLASTQTYHKITVPENLAPAGGLRRPIVQETNFEAFRSDRTAGRIEHHSFGDKLYPNQHPKDGYLWKMAIDLTKCTGCSACVVACQAENNVAVVGKDEVRRRRDMHWLRIDRYYSGEGDDVDVVHQPMMCQHCENASCENVCPVLATVHTSEGLNAQVYNRCVGTRYCANNCAYKVRRFNWFQYERNDELENMVLNPDVTVRSRGIMEKCSFCVQRIQEAKIETKRLKRGVTDEDLQTACQQSCPADAIVFGDANNRESNLSQLLQDNPRAFRVLEEIDVEPSVSYLTLVRNRADAKETGADHHA